MGTLAYWFMPRARANAAFNQAHVLGRPLGDREVKAITKRVFRNFCLYLIEVMRFPYLTRTEISRRVVLHETEEFRRALATGKGVIFASIHFGNMELAGVKLSHQFAPMTLPSEIVKPRRLYNWLVAHRRRHNVTLIPYKVAARGLISALRKNEFLGLMVDLGARFDHKSVPVRLFGKHTQLPSACALLSHRTGAPIIFGYAPIDENGTVHGHAFPLIAPAPDEGRDAYAQRAMQTIAGYMEQAIASHPDQWYIFRRMWSLSAEYAAPPVPASVSESIAAGAGK